MPQTYTHSVRMACSAGCIHAISALSEKHARPVSLSVWVHVRLPLSSCPFLAVLILPIYADSSVAITGAIQQKIKQMAKDDEAEVS